MLFNAERPADQQRILFRRGAEIARALQLHNIGHQKKGAEARFRQLAIFQRRQQKIADKQQAEQYGQQRRAMRRMRRRAKSRRENRPAAMSRLRVPPMRKPEITKKISTPIKPPGSALTPAWNSTASRNRDRAQAINIGAIILWSACFHYRFPCFSAAVFILRRLLTRRE
ncbi:hypothetical protein [Candidatus Pantoea persica]|uniref:hypothetical protein n=1 Tax=Candidatus Pantoea persica TaxID=2518128 RepID=UPI00215D8B80|nr:hypothetical protein [Candidatus Pantoea persica]